LAPDCLTNDLWGIRRVFAARPGHQIVVGDFTQLEMRVLAAASGDEILLNAIDDDVDLHGLAAGRLLAGNGKPLDDQPLDKVQRNRAKAIAFSLFQGAGTHSLKSKLGVSLREAKALAAGYFLEFPGVKRFIADVHKRVSNGEVVSDLFGRKVCNISEELPVPGKQDGKKRTAERERRRTINWERRVTRNFVIEAPAVTIRELALIRCHQHLGADHPDIQMILSRADELHFEVPDGEVDNFASELPDLMTDLGLEGFGVRVPLKVEVKVGPNWGDLSPFRPRQTCV
jgi:DNA polymerase-1